MLRLSEIRRVKESVDPEWRSPVADAVGASWGLPAGSARWWRSSATHVFVVPGDPRRFLRFAPEGSSAAARLRNGANLAAAFPAVRGLAMPRPLPAVSGGLTETAQTPAGPMVAMLVDEAAGAAVDAESLTPRLARRWGAALACFHGSAPQAGASVPGHEPPDPEPRDPERRDPEPCDPELSAVRAALAQRLGSLDERVHRRVTLHGDFELDNIRFARDRVEAFDADETRTGWAAEDVALATRELRGDEGAPPHPRLFDAFVAGYRSIAPLSAAELEAVPLHALAHSVRRAGDRSMLDEGAHPHDPSWQRDLHASIAEANSWHRRAALEHAQPS